MPYFVLYITLAWAPGLFGGETITTRSGERFFTLQACEAFGEAWSAQQSRTRRLSFECREEKPL